MTTSARKPVVPLHLSPLGHAIALEYEHAGITGAMRNKFRHDFKARKSPVYYAGIGKQKFLLIPVRMVRRGGKPFIGD